MGTEKLNLEYSHINRNVKSDLTKIELSYR